MTPSLRARVIAIAAGATLAGAAAAGALSAIGLSPLASAAIGAALALPIALIAARIAFGGAIAALVAVGDGLARFAEGDVAARVIGGRRDEIGDVVDALNHLGDVLRTERSDGYEERLLLETVVDAAPMVILIANEAGRVVHANAAARAFCQASERLEGRLLDELFADEPPELKALLGAPEDGLAAVERGGALETLHVARRVFRINTQLHALVLIRSLTREVARQEALTYKNAIRLISHELNNSLAPIASLSRSARKMLELENEGVGVSAGKPRAQRIREVLDVIEERSDHLQHFLEGYAAFARLPPPSPRSVAWGPFLDPIKALYPFRVVAVPDAPATFDPAQIQQLFINLLKNAREAGSPDDAIEVSIAQGVGGDLRIVVADRGAGIGDDALRNALLPFYSTKKTDGGVGLALCREIANAHGGTIALKRREGGGVEVECRLPAAVPQL